MTITTTSLAAILLIAAAATGLTQNSIGLLPDGNEVKAYPKQHKGYQQNHGSWDMKPGQYAVGTIAGLQNDENGTAWIVSGHWKASMTEKKEGYYSNKNMSSAAVLDTTNSTMSSNASSHYAKFIASFDMVMPNGTTMHDHKIYNFTLTDMSMPSNHTMVYNGTATITMRGGPVNDVPISVMVMDGNVISILSDSEIVTNHFGDTPIYGTVTKAIKIMK